MAKPLLTAERPAWLDANSFLVSAACHLIALIVLGLSTVAAGRGWQRIELLAQVSDRQELPGEDPELDAIKLEAAPDVAAALGPEKLFAVAPAAVSDAGPIDSLPSINHSSGGLEGWGVGGLGDGLGGRVGDATEFFGLGGSGNSFVYVVDCSGSMSEDHKLERACYELLQSIEQLDYDQQYFVIFYNDGPYPMDAKKPVRATPREFERTRRWVERVMPSGGTNPLPALLYALSFQPDAIYFLSDGKFDPSAIGQLRAYNSPRRATRGNRPRSGGVPIHAIAFVNQETQGLMRIIAHQSGGQFRFVP